MPSAHPPARPAPARGERSRSRAPRRTPPPAGPPRRPGHEPPRDGPAAASDSAAAERHGTSAGFSPPKAGSPPRTAQLLDRGLVVAGRGTQHAGGVAQLRARGELLSYADARALDEPAQRLGCLVALQARQHGGRTANTRNLAPSSVGPSSIAAWASASAALRSPLRKPISARSEDIVTTVSAAPRRRARSRISSVPRSAASRPSAVPEHAEREQRPVLAAVRLRAGALPRLRARPGRPHACGRADVDRVVHRQRRQRRRLDRVARGPPGVAQRGDRGIRLKPDRRRGRADTEQRDPQSTRAAGCPGGAAPGRGAGPLRPPRRGPRRTASRSAPLQRRRSLPGPPRRSTISDSGATASAAPARACARPSSSSRADALLLRGRLVERAREQERGARSIAERQRFPRRVAQEGDRSRVAGGLGVHHLRRDLPGRRAACAQDRRRRADAVARARPLRGRRRSLRARSDERSEPSRRPRRCPRRSGAPIASPQLAAGDVPPARAASPI